MYHSELHTISNTNVSLSNAVQLTTDEANTFLRETPIAEVLYYNIQTIHESGMNGEEGWTEYYTHVFSIIFRRP